ncbi:MAG: ATP-grasp domain-containing protein [Gemmataceae bacterium]|nr:ATP-grasp domain-containing protein [Gemmataceae bacterium]MDW8263884.1 ATP-grasp domain-containing protein [Gemmataceae bacterium]
MTEQVKVLLVGGSVRAAAFSALRAGWAPWCADLFADTDLQACCPAQAVSPAAYPRAFLALADEAPPGPWLYTGGLENHPRLIAELARRRPLWGNDATALSHARSPTRVAGLLRDAGLPSPEIRFAPPADTRKAWLLKPLAGCGGRGIRLWDGASPLPPGYYFQEQIAGPSAAALFVGDGQRARLLGVTRQLVGEAWLHARPFRYCGSIGPLALTDAQRQHFVLLGNTLAAGCGLRGLFGVDVIVRHGVPWTLEVNPRYTASVEVLEHATGLLALHEHRRVFDPGLPPLQTQPSKRVVGKAVLYAPWEMVFPADGPWREIGSSAAYPEGMPRFADVPKAGERIAAGRPILTMFAAAATLGECQNSLRRQADALINALTQTR